MRLISLDKFLELVNLKNSEHQPGDIIDISDFKYYTNSFNFETNQIEKKKILNVKFQGPKEQYEVRTKDGLVLLKGSATHKIYDWSKKDWIEFGKTETAKIKINLDDVSGDLIDVVIVNTHKQVQMYDLEIEDNHNYFTNGILSKNCTGGEAVNYYPSTRFRVTQKEPITYQGEIVGTKIKIHNYKNKAILNGVPNRECFLDVYFKDIPGHKAGVDEDGQYYDMMLELGLIKQHGAWFYMNEDDPDPSKLIKMQGMNGVREYFEGNPEEFQKAKAFVQKAMSGYNDKLDANTSELDEEVEFRKEQLEAQAKREAQIKELTEHVLADNENA